MSDHGIPRAAIEFSRQNGWDVDMIGDLKSGSTVLRFFIGGGPVPVGVNAMHARSIDDLAAWFDKEGIRYAWPAKEQAQPDAKVLRFTGMTKADIDPDHLLDSAKGKLDRVVIIGFTKDGEEYMASSEADIAHAVFDIERAKLVLLRMWDD